MPRICNHSCSGGWGRGVLKASLIDIPRTILKSGLAAVQAARQKGKKEQAWRELMYTLKDTEHIQQVTQTLLSLTHWLSGPIRNSSSAQVILYNCVYTDTREKSQLNRWISSQKAQRLETEETSLWNSFSSLGLSVVIILAWLKKVIWHNLTHKVISTPYLRQTGPRG